MVTVLDPWSIIAPAAAKLMDWMLALDMGLEPPEPVADTAALDAAVRQHARSSRDPNAPAEDAPEEEWRFYGQHLMGIAMASWWIENQSGREDDYSPNKWRYLRHLVRMTLTAGRRYPVPDEMVDRFPDEEVFGLRDGTIHIGTPFPVLASADEPEEFYCLACGERGHGSYYCANPVAGPWEPGYDEPSLAPEDRDPPFCGYCSAPFHPPEDCPVRSPRT